MRTPSFFKRAYWRFLRGVGLGKVAWDDQYKTGIWDYLRGSRSAPCVQRIIALCNGGKLVEFGAGEWGALPLALPKGSFSSYVGYDISEIAVSRARDNVRAAGLTNCQFEQRDMASWEGTSGVSLVVAEECLYYLDPKDAETFLRRCCESLSPGGSILVIVHSAVKHLRTLDTCRRVCTVKDEATIDGRTFITLAGKDT
jgi:cyclopropane fatty-acyl-phospholipid synthase-like methyltransferase